MITISNYTYWLEEQAKLNQNIIAIIAQDKKINYKEYFKLSQTYFSYLRRLGIQKGDKVGLIIGNSPEFLFIINALWFCNAIPVPLNYRLTINELNQQINFLRIKHLIVDEKGYHFTKDINLKTISISDFKKKNSFKHEDYIIQDFSLNNEALIMFTSGSTGMPKAVVHTFESIMESVIALDSLVYLTKADIWLASLPFYHIGGFMIICRSLITGSTLVIPDSIKHESIKSSLLDYMPSHASFVSTTLYKLLEDNFIPPRNLKYVFLGGGPIDSTLYKKAIDLGWNVIKVYGSTETCSMVTALSINDYKEKIDSVGKPLKNVQLKIVDVNGNNLPPLQKGEIAIKSKTLMKKYYGIEEYKKTKDEFFLTGDIGWIDDDGFLFIESRKDNIIITGGENVNVTEVENAIRKLDFIEDVYVFPEKDLLWGQAISAAVVLAKKVEIDQIKKLLREFLPSFKIPKNFYFITEIPRNELGKVDKIKLMSQIKKS
ncbi:MAG: o-succinylbenzoate--CoA ligase [Melioribacter sp.]|nr:o-succinylbenzoate--CoA ligase [Melioribacter sp.]